MVALLLAQKGAAMAAGHTVYVGAGLLLQNMLSTTSSPDSSASMIGQMNLPQLSALFDLRRRGRAGLVPSISWTPFALKGGNEVERRIFVAAIPYAWSSAGGTSFKLGPGWMRYSVGSDGGTVELSNGTGTATFYLPGTHQVSGVFTLNAGLAFETGGNLRVDLDAIFPGVLSSRRSVNLMAALHWGLW